MILLALLSLVLVGCAQTQSASDVAEDQVTEDRANCLVDIPKQLAMIHEKLDQAIGRIDTELGAMKNDLRTKLAKLEDNQEETAIVLEEVQKGVAVQAAHTTEMRKQLETSSSISEGIKDQLMKHASTLSEMNDKLTEHDSRSSEMMDTLTKHDSTLNKFACHGGEAKDCRDIYECGYRVSGVYKITPFGTLETKEVFCEFNNGDIWTRMLRRTSADLSFNRNWVDYKQGFGDAGEDLWLGLDFTYLLTKQGLNKLRLEFTYEGAQYYASYDNFTVGPESQGYTIQELGNYIGNITTGDQFSFHHKGQKFTTRDKDQDTSPNNCARTYSGGWWFKDCYAVSFTARYGCDVRICVRWWTLRPITNLYMKIG